MDLDDSRIQVTMKEVPVADCNVCSAPSVHVFSTGSDRSVTSLGRILDAEGEVFVCHTCSHCQTETSFDLTDYYSTDYRTLTNSLEEDDLYENRADGPIYRNFHMASLFAERISGVEGDILDYGCGKSLVMKHFGELTDRQDIYLFDVSDDYADYWDSFVDADRTATHIPPSEWNGKFAVVSSFFSLEHVQRPVQVLTSIRGLLQEGGLLYCVVPDMYSVNAADMLVVDHVQHYSEQSMLECLARAGFTPLSIDHESHIQASIYLARASDVIEHEGTSQRDLEIVNRSVLACKEIATRWTRVAASVRTFEENFLKRGDGQVVIIGAGIIGTYVFLQLHHPERVAGFVDSNEFKQQKGWQGLPVVPPPFRAAGSIVGAYAGLNVEQVDKLLPVLVAPEVSVDAIWSIKDVGHP